jgi:hypothetical protein
VSATTLLLLLKLAPMCLGVGVLGEYLARVYTETRRRPLWFVDYTLNLAPQSAELSEPRLWTAGVDAELPRHCVSGPVPKKDEGLAA